jgi:hypothetical protein
MIWFSEHALTGVLIRLTTLTAKRLKTLSALPGCQPLAQTGNLLSI